MSELKKAMIACGRYHDEEEIDHAISEMKSRVFAGDDPEEVLHEEGFEPDYLFDII